VFACLANGLNANNKVNTRMQLKKGGQKYKTKQKELQFIKRKVGENNRRKKLINMAEHYNP
jgi:hypothetical protein